MGVGGLSVRWDPADRWGRVERLDGLTDEIVGSLNHDVEKPFPNASYRSSDLGPLGGL